MVHNAVYEDFFVDQTVPHTVALILSEYISEEACCEIKEALNIATPASHLCSDSHIYRALSSVMDIREYPFFMLDDDHYIPKELWFVDCANVDDFKCEYLMLRFKRGEELLGAYRFDREHRIRVGEMRDLIYVQYEEYMRISNILYPDIDECEQKVTLKNHEIYELKLKQEAIYDEFERVSVLATALLEYIRL